MSLLPEGIYAEKLQGLVGALEIGTIYKDESFAHLFPHCGQLAEAPWRLLLVCLESVWTYLRACRWFRRIRSNGFFCLGGHSYYLGKHVAHLNVAIRFDPDPPAFICQLEGS